MNMYTVLPCAGEYVAVEFIESVLGKNECVEQVWLYGSSFESCLVAVVVPNKGPLMAWAKHSGGALASADFAAVCASREAREFVLGSITATGAGHRRGAHLVVCLLCLFVLLACHCAGQPSHTPRLLHACAVAAASRLACVLLCVLCYHPTPPSSHLVNQPPPLRVDANRQGCGAQGL